MGSTATVMAMVKATVTVMATAMIRKKSMSIPKNTKKRSKWDGLGVVNNIFLIGMICMRTFYRVWTMG